MSRTHQTRLDQHAGDDGFTLVETLVALAAGAMLLTFLGQGLKDMRDSWMLARDSSHMSQTRTQGLSALDQLVRGALVAEEVMQEQPFDGTPRKLSFLTSPPQAFATMGLVRADITLDPQASGYVLRAKLISTSNGVSAGPFVLLENLPSASFSFAVRDAAQAAKITDVSRHQGNPPAAVRFTFVAQDKSTETRLLIPQMTRDGRCLFDPVSLTCRI
jgi:prepilin-type N-terminal cleavage/methylation domain-containing protein